MSDIHDQRAERIVAGWLLNCEDLGSGADWQRVADITPGHFAADPVAREAFAAAAELHATGKAVGLDSVAAALHGRVAPVDLNLLSGAAPTSAYFGDSLQTLREMHRRRQFRAAGLRIMEAAEKGEGIAEAAAGLASIAEGTGPQSLRTRMADRLFSRAKRPPEAVPRFTLGDVGICTAGNLTAISAAVKSGKSSFLGAMLAAVAATDPEGVDCLGVTASNPAGLALVHLDTEQSIADHWAMIDRALRRANVDQAPPWLRSYCITGFSLQDARAAMKQAMEDARREHGGIFAVMLDGVADLVSDVNDPEECNAFVAGLHGTAIEYDCPIVGVIHLNPGTDKTRGHLGSQLERKAETNLRLDKEGDITVVWSEKNRKGSILKNNGPRFIWSTEAGMHVSTATVGATKKDHKRAELREIAEGILLPTGKGELPYSEFLAAIAKAEGIPAATARHRFDAMKKAGAIGKTGFGLWGLAA